MPPAPAPPPFAAVIVAGGSGSRAGGSLPKQFARWRGKPVLRHSFEAMARAKATPIIVVVPEGEAGRAASILERFEVRIVAGGRTRQLSVRAGLEALEADHPTRVLIHDAARPDLPRAVIERVVNALSRHEGAIPVLPMIDSVATADGDTMGAPVRRDSLRRVQTPQGFRFDAILAAHRAWTGEPDAGDDAQVLRAAGGSIALVPGDERLAKLTYAGDLKEGAPPMRIGQGYDVHRLAAGEELWLGGIRIEHETGLAGHSDADVVLHALTDAVLGALGAGDIGTHFPPSDPQWAGAASSRFVEHAAMLAREAGYAIGNIDLTVICEAPKIGPQRDAMRERIATLLDIDANAVSVKATTTEGLGPMGRREGIAAQAVVLLQRIRKDEE